MFLTSFLRARSLILPLPRPRESVSEHPAPAPFPSAAWCPRARRQSLPQSLRRHRGSHSGTMPQSGVDRSPRGCVGSGSYRLPPPPPLRCRTPLRHRSCLALALRRPSLQSCVRPAAEETRLDVFPAQSCHSLPRSLGSQGTLPGWSTQSQRGSDIFPPLRRCQAGA